MTEILRPRQNRVSPYGEIVATTARGLFMGNRGDLHAPDGTFSGEDYASRAWIFCTLNHREGRKVAFDAPGRYFPLFFFDEAVALAAGHRPCGHCQGSRLTEFKHAWELAFGENANGFKSVRTIDAELHRYRRGRRHRDMRYGQVARLPNGTFVEASGACLLLDGRLYPWSWNGYGRPLSLPTTKQLRLITPDPMIRVLSSGYAPVLHSSVSDTPCRRRVTEIGEVVAR